MFTALLLLLSVLVIIVLLYFTIQVQRTKSLLPGLPRGKDEHFFLGHLPQTMTSDSSKAWLDLVGSHSICVLRLFTKNYIFVNSLSLATDILVKGQNNYKGDHSYNRANYDLYQKVFGRALANVRGNQWKFRRELFVPIFHTSKFRSIVLPVLLERTDSLITKLEQLSKTSSPSSSVDVDKEFGRLTQAVIGAVIFGKEMDTDYFLHVTEVFGEEFQKGSISILPPKPSKKFLEIRTEFNKKLEKIISDFKENENLRKNESILLNKMLDNPNYSTREICSEIIGFLFAGYDTTSHTLAFAFYLLSKNPKKLKKLLTEISQVTSNPKFHDNNGNSTWSETQLSELVYTSAVFTETLRLFPIAFTVVVEPVHDVMLGGYNISKDTEIMIFIRKIMMDPNNFPNPEKFRPERWLPNHPKASQHPTIVFSVGAHQCIGKNLAYFEGKIVLAKLLPKFSFALAPNHVVDTELHLTMRPKGGMPMVCTKM